MRWTILGFVVAVAGCGDDIIPIETAPVSGTATYKGKPLEDYRVYFYSMGHPAKEPATGRVAADGSFTLSIREPGDGAMVGMNQVWLAFDPELPEPEPGRETAIVVPPPKVKIPERYLNRDNAGITVEVPPEGIKSYKLELE